MHVFIPDIGDTAYIKDMEDEELLALCDKLNEARKVSPSGVVRLRWTPKSSRDRKQSLLIIVKYWVTPMGIRKIRFQSHRVYENGRIGTREIFLERRQGREVRW